MGLNAAMRRASPSAALEQLGARDDADDGADGLHLRGAQALAGEEHPADERLADHAAQVAGAAVHADTELGEPERSVFGCDDEIARRGEHEPGAQRGAGDGADHRYRAFLDGEERLADVEHALAHVVAVHRREVVEVVSGTEVLAVAGQHDGPHSLGRSGRCRRTGRAARGT